MRHLLLLLPLVALLPPSFSGRQATPEAALRTFVARLNVANVEGAAQLVDGSPRSPEYAKWGPQARTGMPKFTFSELKVVSEGDSAKASYLLSVWQGRSKEKRRESIELVRRNGIWRLVPGEAPADDDPKSYLGTVAHILANPEHLVKARRASEAARCVINVKILVLAAERLALDRDDRLAFTAANVRTAFRPYLDSPTDDVWRCPAGGVYSFNPALAGVKLSSIAEPKSTVMFYEGRDGKLDFRHDGKASVGFADGSSRHVTPEEAKGLRWKP